MRIRSPTIYHHERSSDREHASAPRLQTGQKRPDLPSKRCDKHGGRLIDVYCSDHNAVGCSTCLAVGHSSCSDIKFIPDVANGIRNSTELQDLERKLSDIKQRLAELKKRKQGHLQQLREEKDKIKKEIKDLRNKIDNHLDKMEKALMSEVDTLFDERINAVNNANDVVNDMTVSVETIQKDLTDAKQKHESELFVHLKDGSASLSENMNMLRNLEKNDHEIKSVKWYPNQEIKKQLLQDNIFGRASVLSVPKSATHIGDYSLLLDTDKETCDILDMCLGSTGFIFVTDFGNKNLKKLNELYTVKDVLKLSGGPISVCEIDNTRIALTLVKERKVQFVSQDTLTLGKSFSVGERCRNICAHDNFFYVCCGGNAEKGEGPGHIEVYNIDGKRIRYVYGEIVIPCSLCPTGSRNFFLFSHGNFELETDLFVMDMNEQTMSELKLKKLSCPDGIVRVGDGMFCVAGCDSNNVVLVSEDGQLEEELFTEKDGIVAPQAVCFDEKRSRLILSLHNSNVIKVFKLVM